MILSGSISLDDIDIVLRAIGTTVTAEELQAAQRAVRAIHTYVNIYVIMPYIPMVHACSVEATVSLTS